MVSPYYIGSCFFPAQEFVSYDLDYVTEKMTWPYEEV